VKFYETKYIMEDVEISSSGQNLYMTYKLRMSRYGGILGGGHLPWALLLLVLGVGFRMANSWSECVTSAREIKLYVMGTVRCV
jgi:hypothetical protein